MPFTLSRERCSRSLVALPGLIVAFTLVLSDAPRTNGQEPFVPTVSGPIPSEGRRDPANNYTFYSTPMNLVKMGYVEEEYFISGTATRYSIPATSAQATAIGTMPYRTRIVVRRPATAKTFNGIVVVDWQNVTAGHDIDTEWSLAGEFFVRSGWAWVGASVQRVGVHGFDAPDPRAGAGLRQWSRTRYGSLDVTNNGNVTDDSQSYDVFTQIARMLKHPRGVDPFDGLKVERVYAGGGSQSAAFLMRYYNMVHPLSTVYDGFVVGLGGGTPRSGLPTKLLKVHTETDVWRGQATLAAPDTDTVRTWQIAGASHVGAAMLAADPDNFHAILGGVQQRHIQRPPPAGCARPFASDVETDAVFSAAYAALERWRTNGIAPSVAERIQVAAAPPAPGLATIVRDKDGIALGGIRLPRVAVPTALNTGENLPADIANPGSCALLGTHVSFEPAKVQSLYKSLDEYMRQVRRVVDNLVRRGFVLREDAPSLIRNAQSDFAKAH